MIWNLFAVYLLNFSDLRILFIHSVCFGQLQFLFHPSFTSPSQFQVFFIFSHPWISLSTANTHIDGETATEPWATSLKRTDCRSLPSHQLPMSSDAVGHHNHFLVPCGFSVARFCAGSYAPFQLLSSSVHLTALLCPEGTASSYSSTH